jgi:CheY-like chemotaxis protein
MAFVGSPQTTRFHLAIVDLNLPKNDGIEILGAMRRSDSFATVPVVVFTSSASPRDRARMEAFHIARYLSKPNDLEEYLAIGSSIREVLEETGTSEISQEA